MTMIQIKNPVELGFKIGFGLLLFSLCCCIAYTLFFVLVGILNYII